VNQVANSAELRQQLAQQGITRPLVAKAEIGVDAAWLTWNIPDASSKKVGVIRLPRHRPDFVKQVAEVDKTQLITDDGRGIARTVNSFYDFTVNLSVERLSDMPVPVMILNDIFIDADLRGLGVGRHVMESILADADEKGYIITLTPTPFGDGSLETLPSNLDERRKRNQEHYLNLRKFYTKFGFQPSPLYSNFEDGTRDRFGNELIKDKEFLARAKPIFADEIGDMEMIRFPGGGEPPAAMFVQSGSQQVIVR
jgi:GNAT superfamily N-acetyltransferase